MVSILSLYFDWPSTIRVPKSRFSFDSIVFLTLKLAWYRLSRFSVDRINFREPAFGFFSVLKLLWSDYVALVWLIGSGSSFELSFGCFSNFFFFGRSNCGSDYVALIWIHSKVESPWSRFFFWRKMGGSVYVSKLWFIHSRSRFGILFSIFFDFFGIFIGWNKCGSDYLAFVLIDLSFESPFYIVLGMLFELKLLWERLFPVALTGWCWFEFPIFFDSVYCFLTLKLSCGNDCLICVIVGSRSESPCFQFHFF